MLTSDRDALLATIKDRPLDQAAWAALADWMVNAGDQAGYDVVTGRVLADFGRFAVYEGLRAEGFTLSGGGGSMPVMFVRRRASRDRPNATEICDHTPEDDVRWWLLYVETRGYDAPPKPTDGSYRLLSRGGVLQWVRDPKGTAEPRMTTTG